MEFRKIITMTLYARQQKRYRCIEQSFGLCGKRRGWDDSNCIETCILPYMKQITSPGLMHETGRTGMTLRDRIGREVVKRLRMGHICKPMADSCQCMAKTTTIW